MSWAMRRRLIILGIIAGVVAVLIGILYFTAIRQAPSCSDGKQNQDEEGIDCGGGCAYYCSISQAAPSVRFVRPVSPVPGRTDVVAYIDNPNPTAAARHLNYVIQLYSPSNIVVAEKTGSVDLAPAATVPVFVPNFFSGSETVARAFITFANPPHLWFKASDTRVLPRVEDVRIEATDMPRITASAVNPAATPMKDIEFVITVFDGAGNAMAASRTVAPAIPAQGRVSLVFTWPGPFESSVARVEVLPIVPL